MRVVEIEIQDHQKRYVVIDDTGMLVEPIVRYLKYLDLIGAARQTLRSYAHMLRLYWEYVTQQQLDWQHLTPGGTNRSCTILRKDRRSRKIFSSRKRPSAFAQRPSPKIKSSCSLMPVATNGIVSWSGSSMNRQSAWEKRSRSGCRMSM